jgi:hypothetical protein
MREPHFWTVTDKRSRASAPVVKLLLTPLSMLYRWAGTAASRRPRHWMQACLSSASAISHLAAPARRL